jgi:hypothetical protein
MSRSPRYRPSTLRRRGRSAGTGGVAGVLVGVMALTASCGGGDSAAKILAPVVRSFSPFMSPIDFNTLQQNPTFTDPTLTVSCDPAYPGKVVIYFNEGTVLDPASIFTGGVPALGIDPSALKFERYVPGTGNVLVPVSLVTVEPTRIILTPATLPLPLGQYTVGVFSNIRAVPTKDGKPGKGLAMGPVFHSFSVGDTDTIRPAVVATNPVNDQIGVGAGTSPPAPPPGLPSGNLADVRTNIFGPTSPDVTVRFNEPVRAASVNLSNVRVVNAGAFVPGGGAPPAIAAAPGFPKLKSEHDGATLPSNGHELIWRPDPALGGFPFGTIIAVTVVGEDPDADGNPTNGSPIQDLAGNRMEFSHEFQFQTVAPPDVPANPFPEYAVWWSASDRVGAVDTISQECRALTFIGSPINPGDRCFNDKGPGIKRNTLPQFTDKVSTAQHIPSFDPRELLVHPLTNLNNCHSYVFVQSANTGQIVVVHTRTSLPVALINTPTPGGIALNGGTAGDANVLVVTNSSANTLTFFDISNITPGTTFLSGPIFVLDVVPTGNTPRAITISGPTQSFLAMLNRDAGQAGAPTPVVLWVDFTDGVLNTMHMGSKKAAKQFALGVNSSPNDVSMTFCIVPLFSPPYFFAAVSQGGQGPGEGKVAYYVSGPGCSTGASTGATPDSIVGDLGGLDGPDGLDNVLTASGGSLLFVVAESGSQANRVTTLGTVAGAGNNPRIVQSFTGVGSNPTNTAHRTPWGNPCMAPAGSGLCSPPVLSCWYFGTEQFLPAFPTTGVMLDLYVCARGAGHISVLHMLNGARDIYSPIPIPGVRRVATAMSQ